MSASPTICSLPLSIVLRICLYISVPLSENYTPGGTIRRDLVAMALACRSLSDPALDTLWHTLRSLAPLLCTLPEDLLCRSPVQI